MNAIEPTVKVVVTLGRWALVEIIDDGEVYLLLYHIPVTRKTH